MALLALAMMIVGLGFKVSAAPFHVWTPDVYQGAPAPVVGLMSTAPKAAAFAVLLRITFSGFASMSHRWSIMLWIIAALSMTIGNLGALMQRDVKRMLAYSSIAHAGYLLAAFTALPHQGIAAACFYTASYAAMNVGAFIVVTEAAGFNESLRTVEDYQGLALRRPVLAGLLAFFLLSLIGIPFTGGFFGKFYVFAGALQAGHVWLAVIGLINSGVACYYYLRLLASVYSRRDDAALDMAAPRSSTSVPAGVALALTAAATLVLGVMPGRVLHLADYASWMLQPAPAANATAVEPGTQTDVSAAER
jgi:NADH-quinone oxidoreductase subunit N